MDDQLEDKVFYQTFALFMKIVSKLTMGLTASDSPVMYAWKICRLCLLRPDVIFCGLILFIFLLYFQAVDVWSRGLLERIQSTLGRQRLQRTDTRGDYQCWEEVRQQSSAFAILGRRPRMEDRFIIEENVNNNTGISFFAVFDGHGGVFAADFARDVLVKNIFNKLIEVSRLQKRKPSFRKANPNASPDTDDDSGKENKDNNANSKFKGATNSNNNSELRRRESLRKTHSSMDDCSAAGSKSVAAPDVFTTKLNLLMRVSGAKGTSANNNNNSNNNNNRNAGSDSGAPPDFEAKCYVDDKGKINFGKMITDEVLSADYKLVEAAKRSTNIAGTTALIAIIQGSKLIVANVGDSRGVMCDSRGMAIPLSFDHKPQQVRERKRIHDAGGFIAFRGVWRVAGVLATSRALGDYPLKDKNLVIANPDILTFDLNDHKPSFLILASDGLWDTFSNEEACGYVAKHLNEPDFGAKSLAMQSYSRGSADNITVLVIVFKNGVYRMRAASGHPAAKDAETSAIGVAAAQSKN